MNAISRSVDTSSKRWLTVLAVTAGASVVFVAYSFVRTLSPTGPSVVAPQKPTPTPTEEAPPRSEPDWNAAQVVPGSQAAATRVDPFAAQYAAAAKAATAHDPVARQQDVHRQAEYLRNLVSQGKLPEGLGNLTKQQVDEMEQRGITIQ
ncbi:MAG: hypothetical protein ACLPT4_00755 [Verrucomicrobiia bacterium]